MEDPREEDLKSELEYLNAQRKKWNYFALGLLVLCFGMISSSFLLLGFLYFLPFFGLFAGLLVVAAWANADEVEKRAKRLSARLAEDFTKIPDQIDVRELGRLERAVWPRQIIAAAIWGTEVAWVNYMTSHFVVGFSPIYYVWLGVLAGILFGAWGVAAAYIGATMGIIPVFGLEISALQSIGIFFAASISAWAFRLFGGDPRLKNLREGFLFMMFGVVLPSLAYALVTSSIWFLYGLVPNLSALVNFVIPSWFLGTTFLALIFGFPMLLVSSRMVVNVGAYCRGWFS